MPAFDQDVFVRSPREATKALWPKQRNIFLVKFYPNGTQNGADPSINQGLSFVVKMVDRPKISPKTEELNQYNKRRQVYTSFKSDPVRFQFYDDVNNTAMTMWQNYAQYYFGDFRDVGTAYTTNDVIASRLDDDHGTGFGFVAQGADGQSNYFFNRIELYHFYLGMYDVYQMINPRITAFDPDEVEYDNASPSLISMSISYENLQYVLQRRVSDGTVDGQPFAEFATGAPFDGDVIDVGNPPQPDTSNPPWYYPSSSTPIDRLLASAQGNLSRAIDYRFNGTPATGALGMFGDFQFAAANITRSLTDMALHSVGLASGLDYGRRVDPLTVVKHTLQGFVNTAVRRGIDAATWDVAMGRAQPMLSGWGTAGTTIASTLISQGGEGATYTSDGVVLTPDSYGQINSQQGGTAQYGYRADIPYKPYDDVAPYKPYD